MYAVAEAIRGAKESNMDVKLVFSNKTRDDILCKTELDQIVNDPECNNVQIIHTITREQGDLGPGIKSGRVSIEMLREIGFPEPGEDTLVLQCGPRAMIEANKAILKEAGHDESRLWP